MGLEVGDEHLHGASVLELAARDPLRSPLYAPDGTFYLPDFAISWRSKEWYWEHFGRLDEERYRNHWETKRIWYDRHCPGRLVTTEDGGEFSRAAAALIDGHFS